MTEKIEDKLNITISDELTINHAVDIYSLLAEGLRSDRDILISIPVSVPVDVTFLQILHSFLAKCESVNKKVFFEINGQNELVTALINMGYYDTTMSLQKASIKMGR